jgi:tetratricopeptide (TPR) repeat protein
VQAGRPDLHARILGQEGNARARMGQTAEGLALVQRGLALALEHNLAGAAAEIYQRLADSLEHAGDYASAKESYLTAFDFCQANAIRTIAQLCIACLTVVLRQTGEWERAMTLCREVLASQHGSAHARTVASGMLGSLYALRGQPRHAQPLLLESAALAQQIEDCHYAVPALRWAVSFFGMTNAAADARACANALARIASATGQPEALSALAHALGEVALLDGDPQQAVQQFRQALDLLRDVAIPYCHAGTQLRAGIACAAANQREAAVVHLTNAYRSARKLGARPLASASPKR